jgi:hypothetical protein
MVLFPWVSFRLPATAASEPANLEIKEVLSDHPVETSHRALERVSEIGLFP